MNVLETITLTEARDALVEAKSWIEELYRAHRGVQPAELVSGDDRRMHPIIGAINRANAIIEANSSTKQPEAAAHPSTLEDLGEPGRKRPLKETR